MNKKFSEFPRRNELSFSVGLVGMRNLPAPSLSNYHLSSCFVEVSVQFLEFTDWEERLLSPACWENKKGKAESIRLIQTGFFSF